MTTSAEEQSDRVTLALAAEAQLIDRGPGCHKSGDTYVLSHKVWDRFERYGYIVNGDLTPDARQRGQKIADGYRSELRLLRQKRTPNARAWAAQFDPSA